MADVQDVQDEMVVAASSGNLGKSTAITRLRNLFEIHVLIRRQDSKTKDNIRLGLSHDTTLDF